MSPLSFDGDDSYVRCIDSNGFSGNHYVSYLSGIRPVINLKPNVLNSGSGTASDPFIIK